ncbi:hypothetical protein LBW94_030810 [Nocardia sp. alder85J]|nr:hypothetical protein [Nocardia sp. alder85J]MCX4096756.1 hypothetical protein [Nocardia sp. alder85J]
MERRLDDDLWELDVEAAIRGGLPVEGPARTVLFTDAAIAAARDAEDFGIGPYPMMFLADCVRSMGLEAVRALPEPVIGAEAIVLVRSWMSAARTDREPDIVRDMLFARWLAVVGSLMDARRSVRQPGDRTTEEPRGGHPPGAGGE